ncbi:hypothetical protein G6F40_013828 [Rhizopus arrhizus]|nr:hypothetical protein G6F40_013828 [Rhizopus arrhizus]
MYQGAVERPVDVFADQSIGAGHRTHHAVQHHVRQTAQRTAASPQECKDAFAVVQLRMRLRVMAGDRQQCAQRGNRVRLRFGAPALAGVGIQQYQLTHLTADLMQAYRHRLGEDTAHRPAQQVHRTLRLQRHDAAHVVVGHRFDAGRHRFACIQRGRLKAVHRTCRLQRPGQGPIVPCNATGRMQHEQRSRPGGIGGGQGNDRPQRVVGQCRWFSDARRQRGHGWLGEQGTQAEIAAPALFDGQQQVHRRQRVAAEAEEVRIHCHRCLAAQRLREQAGQFLLQWRARRHLPLAVTGQ